MSKQPNDQHEKQTPSDPARDGEASGTRGGEADKGDASGKGRSRRRGRADQAASSSNRAAGPDAAAAPSAGSPATPGASKADDGKKSDPKAADPKTSEQKSPEQKSPAEKADPKAADTKPGDNKAADKDSEPGDQPSQKPAASSSGSSKPGAASGGAGGGSPRPPAAAEGGGKGGGKSKSGPVALVLVILLGLIGLFFGWQGWQKLQAQQARLAEVESISSQAATSDELTALENRLEENETERDAVLDNALSELESEFTSYRSQVDETLDQVLDELSSEQEPDAREWLHAEAAYLLRLANQRLQLERDVEGAAALLRTADERLSEAENPALLSVRRAIASELSILDGVPQVDRTGIYLALNAQQERLAMLPLSRELEEIPARSGMEEAPTGEWQEQLSRFGQELKDLVVIRHHDEAMESLITPEQESYLRQSARLVLEQSQLALLKEEQELFEASIDKVLSMINAYYATDREEVQAVITRLEELKTENIRPELPDISGSQQALASFIERRFGSRSEQGDDA
ncbi:uroporphyrinogen-III C-methyltransferase [Halomonas sp.]|uniref:uroporphyrinogen-III C-methyltransferase n=1 Tax=Halomonas sp. TaxID=1486246 RepID=UPI00356A2808